MPEPKFLENGAMQGDVFGAEKKCLRQTFICLHFLLMTIYYQRQTPDCKCYAE